MKTKDKSKKIKVIRTVTELHREDTESTESEPQGSAKSSDFVD